MNVIQIIIIFESETYLGTKNINNPYFDNMLSYKLLNV